MSEIISHSVTYKDNSPYSGNIGYKSNTTSLSKMLERLSKDNHYMF